MVRLYPLGLLPLLLSGSAWAAEADPAEIESFKSTVSLFQERAREFEAETRATISAQEAAERAAMSRSYDAIISDLQTDGDALRATSIRRFEQFLERYPGADHSAHVMFRLAELYYEISEEKYQTDSSEYDKLITSLGDNLDEAPEEPKKDYRKTIALYQSILEKFPGYEYTDGCYYMLGYSYGETSAQQYDEKKALGFYQTLIDKFPASRFAAAAHFQIAEYYFDTPNGLAQAQIHYQKVIELDGVDGGLYGNGLYKLAWTNYRLSDYRLALEQLDGLLDWSYNVFLPKKGRRSDTDPEAIRYTAISFVDEAQRQNRDVVSVAEEFYRNKGQKEYEPDVYKQIGDVLTQQALYDEAIALYTYFQKRWPNDPENPDFQWKIAQLYATKSPPDLAAIQAAQASLNETYSDRGSWYRANRAQPEALARAASYIEQSLFTVATAFHSAAVESRRREDYQRAADAYGEYLRKFPFADDYYEVQWYRAETLVGAQDVTGAIKEYQLLSRSNGHHFQEAALRNLALIRTEQLLSTYTDYNIVPPDAEIAEAVPLKDGTGTRNVFKLGPLHQEYVDAVDKLIAADFNERIRLIQEAKAKATGKEAESLAYAEQNAKDIAKFMEENRVALDYNVGRVLVAHGHFPEARERFARIITNYPQREEAAFAAKLDSDTYAQEGDLLAYREVVSRYMGMSLGPGTNSTVAASEFRDRLERVDFTLAEDLSKTGKFGEAAEAFMKFYNTYTKSKFRPLALQNAINNYERSGNLVRSVEIMEVFVNSYPDEVASRQYYFRLASAASQVLELNKAIKYYEALYDRTRRKGIQFEGAADAMFNAAMLRVGIGDFEGAAKNYEIYAADFPERSDAEPIAFLAGEQWESVSPQRAIAFYQRYLRTWPSTNPDHVMEALARIAVLTEKTGGQREIDAAWEEVLAGYRRLESTGRIGFQGRKAAASAEYRKLQAEYEAFKPIKYTTNDQKNAELVLKVKAPALKALEAHAEQMILTFRDFEYGSGAGVLVGRAYLDYANMIYDLPDPKGVSQEEIDIIREEMDKIRLPVEDKGKNRLQAVLSAAASTKQWSRFQTEAQLLLAERFPAEFPASGREEVRGNQAARDYRLAAPIPLKDPNKESKAPEGTPEPTP